MSDNTDKSINNKDIKKWQNWKNSTKEINKEIIHS